jgi:hypothetical protein
MFTMLRSTSEVIRSRLSAVFAVEINEFHLKGPTLQKLNRLLPTPTKGVDASIDYQEA